MPATQWTVFGATLWLVACGSTPHPPDAPTASCRDAAMQQIPPGLNEAERRCMTAALVTWRCSDFEPSVAGDANRMGRQCTVGASTPNEMLECCRAAVSSRPGSAP